MKFQGEKLRKLRNAKNWDQHRLAQAAREHSTGITQASISRYENGMEPQGRNALALAKALGVRVDEFYAEDGDPDDAEAAAMEPLAGDLHFAAQIAAAVHGLVDSRLEAFAKDRA